MANEEYEDYLKFIDCALEISNNIPRYFSKYSNKIYCNHQKLAIYILMQKMRRTYRGIISWLKSNNDACLYLGICKIPVHTTIVRFAKRISKYLHLILDIRKADSVAVDSTGFELESKSYYYRKMQYSKDKQRAKRFMKLSIVADIDKQLILDYRIRRDYKRCNTEFRSMIKDMDINYVIADKGYDSYDNRNFVIRKLKAIPIIPVRNYTNYYGYLKGRRIKGDKYHQRSKIESIFSSIKRKYGSVIRSRSFISQKTELIAKLIAYNIDRKISYLLFIIRGLHQNLLKKTL